MSFGSDVISNQYWLLVYKSFFLLQEFKIKILSHVMIIVN